ncbi:splicing factor 3B subunit 2 isoform X2 [Toxorhynchites rutilus septentrionalis]|uniref:splicing factor 3B subunit 2 isoform X2 n=1 Tax=Toxorhynchites rutilus septentrionalis TaxID=329112 RepID=UPI00247B26DF|nr:splicing factor 3B subunit 2 isoform X2 [Toxorhynchites rutilus septentrionalis]
MENNSGNQNSNASPVSMLPPPPPPPGMLMGGPPGIPPNWQPGGPPLMGAPGGPPPSLMGAPGGPPPSLMGPPSGPLLDDQSKSLPPLMSLTVGNPDQDQANKKPSELILPKALEDVLAMKTVRAKELGAEEVLAAVGAVVPPAASAPATPAGVMSSYLDMDGDSDDDNVDGMAPHPPIISKAEGRLDRNRRRKQRKKENRKARREQSALVLLQREKDKEGLKGQPANEGESSPEKQSGKDSKDRKDEKNEEELPNENGDGKGSKDAKKDKDKEKTKSKEKSKDKTNKKDKESKKDKEKNSSLIEDELDKVEIEYVPEKVTIADLAPMYRQFYRVFEIFKLETKAKEAAKSETTESEKAAATKKANEKDDDDDDDDGMDLDDKDDKEKISKRKMKKLTRLSVAELKQLVARPDVVEMHDVTARDPKLLIQLKSHRNTVQVPRHWCFKRKYLQGKRGIEKPPFELPAFIKKTGIMEMRASLQEKDEAKTLKAKMRERARPKMGKIDIDYQKLHDAFFKWQTKPRMTIHGDLYYEGKEFETRLKEKKPGDLSEELRVALGMPIGPACHKIPPPWLIAQQRYGPPPSYPNLRIPGLNAPIPEGCSFGYHAGGWGKPPVDENGKPLYGDVFGMSATELDNGLGEEDIDRTQWGELESESEESSEEEEEDGEDLGAPADESGLITPAEGLVTPSGLTSGVPAGMETPDTIELRKKKIESEMEDNETPVLYQVLQEKRNERIGASMMGSTHVYDLAAATAAGATGGPRGARGGAIDREGMVELALDPSELDMDNDAMAQRYEQQMREQQSHLQKEDLSDMLAEHVARQKSKRKRQQTDTTSKQTKKYKEFKF